MSESNEKIVTHITDYGFLFSSQWIFVQGLFCPLREVISKYLNHNTVQSVLYFFSAQEMIGIGQTAKVPFRYCNRTAGK